MHARCVIYKEGNILHGLLLMNDMFEGALIVCISQHMLLACLLIQIY